MATAEIMAGVHSKIERAKKHIGDLNAVLVSSKHSGGNEVLRYLDPKTGNPHYRVTSLKPIPDEIPLIAGDAIHCLRSALDQLAYRFWESFGSHGSIKTVAFPVTELASNYEAEIRRKIKGITGPVEAAFKAVEAYQGGNGDDIWRLHNLDIIDKHRMLVTAHVALDAINIARVKGGEITRFSFDFGGEIHDAPLKVGEVLLRDGKQHLYDNVEFTFEISLNEPSVIKGEPLLMTLQKLADVVDNIVVQLSRLL